MTARGTDPHHPLLVLPLAIRTMLRVARIDPRLAVAHRSAENALLYSYLWSELKAEDRSLHKGVHDAAPAVIVIHDKNHGFRWYCPDTLYSWLTAQAASAYVVWNMSSPLASGRLWSEFVANANVLDRTVLIIDEEQLRHAGVDLRREGSSERTLQDFWQQLYTKDHQRRTKDASPLAQLTACKGVVVCFDGGVLYYSRDAGRDSELNEALRMYSLGPKSPNARPSFDPKQSGVMFGRDLIVTAAIATAIELESARDPDVDLLQCVDYGCRLAVYLHRAHLDAGYAPPGLNQVMYGEERPQPFAWLFQHWFSRNQRSNTSQISLGGQHRSQVSDATVNPMQHSHHAEIDSPFEPTRGGQFDELRQKQMDNLTKALDTVDARCHFTRLSSYLCKSDRESEETMSKAFERFDAYSRIKEFYAPVVLNGPVPHSFNERPVQSFATIDRAASRIITHGVANAIETISERTVVAVERELPNWVPKISSTIPRPRYSWLNALVRSDIDSFSDISVLVRDYVHDHNRKRPLSLAVFGAPGSGKNTTIEALIAASDQKLAKDPRTFNLSQFTNLRDLATAFHQVQDLVLTRKDLPPVVFFDEFDCSLDGAEWGWFKYFLAPMQDGEYRAGENTYHIGRAIFIFSGGVSRKYADFESKMTGEGKDAFERAKGPDFVSRLRGYLDIPSINTVGANDIPNDATKIRRSLILRSILERTLPQIIDSISGEACIDARIIKAMLGVPRFRHEVRSMQAIIEMSHVPKNGRVFTVAELPSEGQLSMHVENLARFDELLHSPS